MATKISQLTSITKSSYTENDLLVLVNYTEPTGTTVNSTITELKEYINDGVLLSGGTLSATTISGDTLYGDGSNLTNLPSEWLYTEIPITSAQILSLYSSPVTLLPAPGINMYYEYKGILEYTAGSTNYTAPAGRSVYVEGDDYNQGTELGVFVYLYSPGEKVYLEFNSKHSAIYNYFVSDFQYFGERVLPEPVNQGVRLVNSGYTLPAEFTNGNGTFLVKLWYKILTFGSVL